jgi:3-keto-disaccharide hydrolase
MESKEAHFTADGTQPMGPARADIIADMTIPTRRGLLAAALAAAAARNRLSGQQAQPFVPKQSDRPQPMEGDEPGFHSIFDGTSLAGWEGDAKYWRAADGVMTGEITPETLIKSNTFLIWRGGEPEDFELKVDYRITSGGNSGVNYRSVVVPDAVTPANRFAMRGYQCDIDGQNRYTGNNYEEKGRLFLAVRGQATHVTGTRPPLIVSNLGDNKELAALIRDDWNAIHIVARGNVLMHTINGRLMSMTIDDDPRRERKGLIGVQVHVGGPMKIDYRNWRIREM